MAEKAQRSFLKRAAAASVAGGVALSLAPVSGAVAQSGGKDTLIVGTSGLSNIPHLNPLDSGWLLQGEINNLMYTPMIRWSQEDFSPAPGIAQEWESSEDGLTWTYRLNPDATWSDGEPITAEDAKFTYDLLRENPVLNSRHGDLVNNFTDVRAEDDHTLVIEIDEPSAMMNHLKGVSIMIMPEHVWGELDDPAAYAGEPDQPTSGPFRLNEYREGERITLTANEDYWEGPVDYDEFVLQDYQTPEAMVQALQAGEVDLVGGLNPQQYEALESREGITTSTGPGRRMQSLTFNAGARTRGGEEFGDGHPALTDPAVRRAIAHAVDKERIVEVATGGFALPGVSYVPPIFGDLSWEPTGDDLIAADVEAGNQLLDEAGYDERDSAGLRVDPESGRPLEFRLFYHSDRPSYAIIQDFLVDWVAELDIRLNAIAMDTTPLNEEQEAGNFDIAFGTWNAGPEPSETLAYHTCARLPEEAEPTDLTFAFYCNEEYDALFEQQTAETDLDTRAGLLRDMQQLLYQDAPAIVLYYENQLEAYNSERWSGFETQPADAGMIREQQGAFGYRSATPAGGSGGQAAGSGSDSGSALPWVIGGLVLVAVAGGGFAWMQRRKTADDRE
ncbi:ABC transporter substrate-binding protein [Streptomyces bohaiensis]|uniref:ABC transporter substrate-binding protein n=1 Tax=Streptomyces bohaiensis TaxID=1431344 RepID=A0ABX1CFR7_9ACTN|nr:ABC transporter substrate-binding protein [Streptomyces bohaiensis]NJQ17186.1 ABC transporter substrate-binding protein [Streptomyces bohaiensis]